MQLQIKKLKKIIPRFSILTSNYRNMAQLIEKQKLIKASESNLNHINCIELTQK